MHQTNATCIFHAVSSEKYGMVRSRCWYFKAAHAFPCACPVNILRPALRQIPMNHIKTFGLWVNLFEAQNLMLLQLYLWLIYDAWLRLDVGHPFGFCIAMSNNCHPQAKNKADRFSPVVQPCEEHRLLRRRWRTSIICQKITVQSFSLLQRPLLFWMWVRQTNLRSCSVAAFFKRMYKIAADSYGKLQQFFFGSFGLL